MPASLTAQEPRFALAICGSPRRGGNTSVLLTEVLGEFQRRGWRTRLVMLSELTVLPCRGCEACSSSPCPQPDDMHGLLALMHEADVIAVGSPVYWGDVTGQLKTFIDRSLPVCDSRVGYKVFAGKRGIAVAVRTGSRPQECLATIETIEHYFGHLGISPVGSLHAEGVAQAGAVSAWVEKLEAARELARQTAILFAEPMRQGD